MKLPAVLLLALACAACQPGPVGRDGPPVVVFVLDTRVDARFIEGQVAELRASDVTHGSLVARVIRSYCRAPILSVPVGDGAGRVGKSAYLDGLERALRYAREHPSTVVLVNVSLGSAASDPREEALLAALSEAGALVIAAAGNDAADAPTYPAAHPGVIAVADATSEGKAANSNYGPHIDLAAPGDITFIDYDFLPYEWLMRQMDAAGTSFAAPRVTATLAFLLEQAPQLTPEEALRILERTARPIADPLFGQGLMGAGLLDVHAAKAAVAPSYRFVHFVLPISLWIVLGVVCAFLCLRHGLVGVLLTLLIWLVALPSSFLLVVRMARYLEFVGGGSVLVGVSVASVVAAAAAVGAAVQGWQVGKAAGALAPPAAVYVAFMALRGDVPGGPLVAAMAAGAMGVALAAAMELRTRRLLAAVRESHDGGWLAAVCRRTWDRRVGRAAVEGLGRTGDEQAVEFLLSTRRFAREATAALCAAAAAHPDRITPWLEEDRPLSQPARRRLLAALELAAERDGTGGRAVP